MEFLTRKGSVVFDGATIDLRHAHRPLGMGTWPRTGWHLLVALVEENL